MHLRLRHLSPETFVDLLEGTLTPDQAAAARRHLDEGCPACRGELAAWERLWARLREPEEDAPAWVVRRALALFEERFPVSADGAAPGWRRVAELLSTGRPTLAAGARNDASREPVLEYAAGELRIQMRWSETAGGWDALGWVAGPEQGPRLTGARLERAGVAPAAGVAAEDEFRFTGVAPGALEVVLEFTGGELRLPELELGQ